MEKNPLEITAADIIRANNKRGRPVNSKAIKFSPEPKSAIISQILREKRSLEKSLEITSKNSLSAVESEYVADSFIDDDFQAVEPVELREEIEIEVEIVLPKVNRTKPKRDKIKKAKKIKYLQDRPEKPFACDYPDCSYAAKLSCNLVKHKRIHTSEKPYICDQCTFRTNFINSLKVHRRIHTAEKPYNCECCGYRCNTSSNLKKHRMHRHPEVAKI